MDELLGVVLALFGARGRIQRLRKYRHLRRFWGLSERRRALIVLSQVPLVGKAKDRQWPEMDQFVELLRFGDPDGLQVWSTILRLYPGIDARVVGADDDTSGVLDVPDLIVVGGPDYNRVASGLLDTADTRFGYRGPTMPEESVTSPGKTVIVDKRSGTEYCGRNPSEDYGYIERIENCLLYTSPSPRDS